MFFREYPYPPSLSLPHCLFRLYPPKGTTIVRRVEGGTWNRSFGTSFGTHTWQWSNIWKRSAPQKCMRHRVSARDAPFFFLAWSQPTHPKQLVTCATQRVKQLNRTYALHDTTQTSIKRRYSELNSNKEIEQTR